MGNRKHTLTFNLDFDEEFNREVNEMIKARVMETIRSNCQAVIDEAVNNTIPAVVAQRIKEISDYRMRSVMEMALSEMMKTAEFRKQIDESTQLKIDKHVNLDLAVSRACADWVNKKLDKLVSEDIISAVIHSLVNKAGLPE